MGEIDLTMLSEGHPQDQLLEELQQRATRDTLSGLLNRATVEQCIKERLQAMAQEETCALFIVDLDNFKQVNDTLGHQAGDQAIRQSARILSSLFRGNDIVGRLGGDEFVVFLYGKITEKLVREKAAAICEKLHLALGNRTIVNLTASVGAYLAAKGEKFEGLYQSTDLALYKAKKAGKHQFCLKSYEGYQEARPEDFRPVSTITLSGLLEKMESGVALLEMGDVPQVIYVSPSFCRIIGANMETYSLPKPLQDLIHPDDWVSLLEALKKGSQGQTVEHTHRIYAGNKRHWLWWQIRAAQIEYDNPNPVMLVTTMDVSRFKEVQQQQEEQIQRLQAAFDQTSKRLWEVDIPTKVFHAYSRDGKHHTLGEGAFYFPESLIEGGWIHPNSLSRFRAFAQELLEGHAQGYGNFAIRSKDTGYYSWVSISYRTLFDDIGRAVRAVGVLEDLPQGFAAPGFWIPAQSQLPEGLIADLILRLHANLELDTVEALWVEGVDISGQVKETRCSQILELEKQKIFIKGDQQAFIDSFNREFLLQQFQTGRRWYYAEYRRIDSGGSIRWVRYILYLVEDPASHQVCLFAYLVLLGPSHQSKHLLCEKTCRDAVSRLYNQETVRKIAETLFSERKSGNCAVALFQINGLEKQPAGNCPGMDQMHYEIAAALSLALGGDCILGQYSAHQIVIVFPSATEKEELRRQMEEAVTFLRRMLSAEASFNTLRFIIGINLMPAAIARYDRMLAQAMRVCAF